MKPMMNVASSSWAKAEQIDSIPQVTCGASGATLSQVAVGTPAVPGTLEFAADIADYLPPIEPSVKTRLLELDAVERPVFYETGDNSFEEFLS